MEVTRVGKISIIIIRLPSTLENFTKIKNSKKKAGMMLAKSELGFESFGDC